MPSDRHLKPNFKLMPTNLSVTIMINIQTNGADTSFLILCRVIPLEVRRRIKLTGAELEEYRQKEKVQKK